MSEYKKRLLELAESLREPYEEVWLESGEVFSVGGNERIVDELVMLINKLEEVNGRTNESE